MEKAQSGRSLLEMLMTLVVMGILTVGSVAGYKAISVRFQKRTVAETISRLVLQRQHEALTRKGLETHSQNVAGPHGVSFDVANDTVNHFITIKVKGPNAELIQALAKEKFLMSMAESITTPEVGGEEASVIMIFNQFQSSNLSSHTAVSCAVGTIAGKGEASVLASDGHTQCYCDLGEMYGGEKCQRDQCFGITLNSCQASCDKWTGDIATKADNTVCDFSATGNNGFCQTGECKENKCFGIILNSCQTSCDKWTGNITTKADDTVCDFSATGNDGFCQTGVCKENKCFGVALNSCQTSCDKLTGNITTKADNAVCDFSATGNDGFCQAGECVPNDSCNNSPCQTCSIDASGNKTQAFVANGTACVQSGLNGKCNSVGQCIPSEGTSCSSVSGCPAGYFCNYGGTYGNYGGGYTPNKCEKVNPMTVEISGVTYYYNSQTDLKSWCRPADRGYNCTWGYLSRYGAESWCKSLGKRLLTRDEFNSVLSELKAVLPRGATMATYWAQGGSFYGEDFFTWTNWTGRPDGYANAGGVVCR